MGWLFAAMKFVSWLLCGASTETQGGFSFWEPKWIPVALAYTLCWWPANRFIQWQLEKYKVIGEGCHLKNEKQNGFNSSALIGVLER